jgi:hypothetical protein
MSVPSSRAVSRARRRYPGCAALLTAVSLVGGAGSALAASPAITRSRAAAIAAEINLRHSDLPTSKQEPNPYSTGDRRNDAQFNTCAHAVPDRNSLSLALSPSFGLPGTSSLVISSEVAVRPTAALVLRDLAASASPVGLSCNTTLTEDILRGTLSKGQTLTVRTYRLPSPGYGDLHAFALRTVVDIRTTTGTTEITVPTYSDEFGFGDGQVEVGYSDVDPGAVPSATLEYRLLAALVARTEAAVG